MSARKRMFNIMRDIYDLYISIFLNRRNLNAIRLQLHAILVMTYHGNKKSLSRPYQFERTVTHISIIIPT